MRNRAQPREPRARKPPRAPLTTRVQGRQDRHGGPAGPRGESRMAERQDPGALPCPAQLTPARFCLGTSGGPSPARAAARQGVGAGALPERGGPAGRLGAPGTPGLALRGLLCTRSSLTRPQERPEDRREGPWRAVCRRAPRSRARPGRRHKGRSPRGNRHTGRRLVSHGNSVRMDGGRENTAQAAEQLEEDADERLGALALQGTPETRHRTSLREKRKWEIGLIEP